MPSLSGKPLRLRDFIRVGNLYFSVVGYRNNESVKCFLRYAPGRGRRFKDGIEYRKLTHDEALKVGERFFSKAEGVFRVKYPEIDEIFKPEERLSEVIDSEVRRVVDFLSGIPRSEMGVTGSRLIGLKESESDVDFVVYGRHWFVAREKIKKGIESGRLSEPDNDTWDFIYRKRKPPLSYDAFLIHERRKFHRAFIGGTYFDLLYVRGYNELNKDIPEDVGKRLGKLKIVAEVIEDRDVFDYPAYYPVKHERISAVLSFTHTYAGQAFRGEVLEAYGQVEEINGKLYLIVGTKRETEDEYIVSRSLMEREGIRDYLREDIESV